MFSLDRVKNLFEEGTFLRTASQTVSMVDPAETPLLRKIVEGLTKCISGEVEMLIIYYMLWRANNDWVEDWLKINLADTTIGCLRITDTVLPYHFLWSEIDAACVYCGYPPLSTTGEKLTDREAFLLLAWILGASRGDE